MLGRGQHDVEEIDHRRCHGMAGDPLHWYVGQVEVNLAGLDLYRARIDLLIETVAGATSRTPPRKLCIAVYGK